MQKQLLPEAEGYAKNNVRRRIWRRFVRVMACVVVFCTTYALILPAITMERNGVCELEEHTHTDNCYSQLTSREMVSLRCTHDTLQIHSHTQACYGADGQLVCGLADFVVHEHNGACLDAEGNLVCGLPVIRVHEHTDACYLPEETTAEAVHEHDESCYTQERGELLCQLDTVEPHVHTDACGGEEVLGCGMEETEAHSHTEECENRVLTCEATVEPHIHGEGCYVQLVCELAEDENHTHSEACSGKVLSCDLTEQPHVHGEGCYQVEYLCGLAEGPGHVHEDTCYYVVYNCGLEEGAVHEHDDSCYEVEEVLICEAELTGSETEPTTAPEETERELICQEQEIILHSHTDACFEIHTDGEGNEVRTLICESLEVREHIHGEGCFVTEEVPVDTEVLTCTLPALHSHSEACYDEAGVLICTEPTEAHSHGEACYDEAGVLICTEPTEGHVHGTMCYGTWVLTCGLEEHTHTEECSVEPEYYCGLEEHSHTETCTDEAGDLICGQEEHIHTEECLLPTYYCGLAEHSHAEVCTDVDGNLICELEEHIHNEMCMINPENLGDPIPECDCGSEIELKNHPNGCARYQYLRNTYIHEKTAEEIYANWDFMDEEDHDAILTFMSWEYTLTEKLEELEKLIENGDPFKVEFEDGTVISVDGIPENAKLIATVASSEKRMVADHLNSSLSSVTNSFFFSQVYDISVQQDDGLWQPANGEAVTLTLETKSQGFNYRTYLQVTHILETTDAILRAVSTGNYSVHTQPGLGDTFPEACGAAMAAGYAEDTLFYTVMTPEDGTVGFDHQGNVTIRADSFSTYVVTAFNVNNSYYLNGVAGEVEGELLVDKHVSYVSEDNYLLELEAFITGEIKSAPTDVVLVIDHSGSMWSAVDPAKKLSFATISSDTLHGTREGYYICFGKNEAGNDAAALIRYYNGQWQRSKWFAIYVKGFENESVAWEQVLKMLIWVYGQDGMAYYTAREIGEELGVSGDVVGAAYKVLDKQFGSIAREPENYKTSNGEYRTKGQYFIGAQPWSRE